MAPSIVNYRAAVAPDDGDAMRRELLDRDAPTVGSGLTDFDFSFLAIPTMVRPLYVLSAIALAFYGIAMFIAIAQAGGAFYVVGLVVAPLIVVLGLVYARVVLEVAVTGSVLVHEVRGLRDDLRRLPDRMPTAAASEALPQPAARHQAPARVRRVEAREPVQLAQLAERIVASLRGGPAGVSELARRLNVDPHEVRGTLHGMGDVTTRDDDGRYWLSTEGPAQ